MKNAKHLGIFLGLGLAGLSLGCEEDKIIVLPPPAVQVDVLSQKPAALVDILWVVDNSESMIQEQALLAQNFESFINGLTVCQGTGVANDLCDFNSKTCAVSGGPCNPPDYNIGVIATDVFDTFDQGKLRRVGLCTAAGSSDPTGGKFRYCLNSNADCTHDANDPNSDPANNTCNMAGAVSFISATTPGAPAAFARAIRVGTGGSGRESGIQAAAMAVGRDTNRMTGQWNPAPSENDGFLRPGASLFMIFVSDEDDVSFGEVSYFYRAFETLKGAGNEGIVSVSAIVGDPDRDGSDGPVRGGCPAEPSDLTAFPGTRYVSLSMYSRGLSSEFKVCDNTRLVCGDNERCRAPVEGLPGVCIPTTPCQMDQDCGNFKCEDERGCITCDNATCDTTGERFLQLLERNGVFGSICDGDYGDVLDALGFEAAGLSRKFNIGAFPNCAEEVCCKAGETTQECDVSEEAALCVKIDGEVIPNDRATGWVYEASSNAIFFDGTFVPATDAQIEVSYTPAPGELALSCNAALQ